MTFHVNIILVRFGLLSDHLLGKSCHMFVLYFDYLLFLLFPVLVLGRDLGSVCSSFWSLYA